MGDDDRRLLEDMLRYAEAVGQVLGSADQDELAADLQLFLAVAHAMQIVGEAAYQLSNAARQQIPEIPWQDIIGMRHRLVHDYRNANVQVVFDTINDDVPYLITELRKALGRTGP